MIFVLVQALLTFVLGFFTLFLSGMQWFDFPFAVTEFTLNFISWLVQGVSFVNAWIDTTYVYSLLTFLLSFSALVHGYHVFMWVLKKIPFLNIK